MDGIEILTNAQEMLSAYGLLLYLRMQMALCLLLMIAASNVASLRATVSVLTASLHGLNFQDKIIKPSFMRQYSGTLLNLTHGSHKDLKHTKV